MFRRFSILVALVVSSSFLLPAYTTSVAAQSIAVSGFTLINADTNKPIMELSSTAPLNLAKLPTRNINIRANTNPSSVGSVRFAYNGNTNFSTQNGAPYSFAGDNSGDYASWTPTKGTHTISATPYTGLGATGTAGKKASLTLTVSDTSGGTPVPSNRFYGVLFGDNRYLDTDWNAGIRVREVELSWASYEPQDEQWNAEYIKDKQWEFQQARDRGYQLVLDFGMQYPPDWARNIKPWKDQYGNTYNRHVNAVWSGAVRAEMGSYIRHVFEDFGTDWFGVRLGSGGWVETMYPSTPAGYSMSYWAFDSDAMQTNPVPKWRPGQASPSDEAHKFYTWYVDNLIRTVNWQHEVVRRYYSGNILQLFAGIGVRPAGWETLIKDNLKPVGKIGVDAAERGVVIDRIIDGIKNKTNVIIVSCSLGDSFATAPWVDELSSDPMDWSSAHWVAYNARRNGLQRWGENTGNNDLANMKIVFKQMHDFGYTGLFWAWSKTLYDGKHASIDNYKSMIATYR